MLIKDPYLSSDIKNRSYSAFQGQNVPQFNVYNSSKEYQKPCILKQPFLNPHYTSQQINPANFNNPLEIQPPSQFQTRLHSYQRQLRSLSSAYQNQQQILNKVTKYQSINQQYHEAMKKRNYELNTKLNDLTYEKTLLNKRHEEQQMKKQYDKQILLKKYQQQNQQILRYKRTISQLIEHKSRLQSQIDHLIFTIQKDNHQGSLQIKQQLIRMQNMQRTLRNIIDTKDQEITQLRYRMKCYQDQNKRLNDMNKTMTLMMGNHNNIKGDIQIKGIDNLSKIQNMDSNIKPNIYQNINNKENIDNQNIIKNKDQIILSELKQQKQINLKLMQQINNMKVKLFTNQQLKDEKNNNKMKKQTKSSKNQRIKSSQQCQQQQQKQSQTIPNISSIKTQLQQLTSQRQKLSNKVYQIYCLSNKQGQKHKSNSLLIFIQKYKQLPKHQLQSLFSTYSILRESLKQKLPHLSSSSPNQYNLIKQIQSILPNKVKSKVISQSGTAILSTIQHTKNMRNNAMKEKEKCSEEAIMNNNLLYLFRLLTVLYRVKNSNKNDEENNIKNVEGEVMNQLLHSIVKAIQSVEENRK